MAKSKSKTKPIDDEEQIKADADEEATEVNVDEEPEAAADVEDETVAEADDEPIADGDEEPVADADGGDDDDKDDEDSVDEGPTSPPAKVTRTTLALIALNLIVAPGLLVLALLDNIVRSQFTYRTIINYTQIYGLPLKSEEPIDNDQPNKSDYTPLSQDVRRTYRLSSEQLSAALRERTKKSAKDFVVVDEPVPVRLRPSDMKPELLADIFGGVGDPVATVEDEVIRLKGVLSGKIEAAAKDVLGKQKTDADKRSVVHKSLLPIAWNVWQAKALEKEIALANGKTLDDLVEDSVQRRLYYDILAPLNVFRPGEVSDAKKLKIEKLADSKTFKIDQLKEMLSQRLDASIDKKYNPEVHFGEFWTKANAPSERDSVEKRTTVAFLLFTLSQIYVPTTNEKLLDKSVERAQIVSGIQAFTNASIDFVRSLQILEDRLTDAIIADRDGWVVYAGEKKDEARRISGFPGNYEDEIDRLVKMAEQFDNQDKRLKHLNLELDKYRKLQDQATKQHGDTMGKLVKARQTTQKQAQQLRDLQTQLHEALVELSDAADRNFRLEAEIRAIEIGMSKKKGGQK